MRTIDTVETKYCPKSIELRDVYMECPLCGYAMGERGPARVCEDCRVVTSVCDCDYAKVCVADVTKSVTTQCVLGAK